QLLKCFRSRSWNRLGQPKKRVVFRLAKILGAEQLLSANNLGAAFGGAFGRVQRLLEVRSRIGGTGSLEKSNRNGGGFRHLSACNVRARRRLHHDCIAL